MKNLATAIIAVMKAVKGVEKNANIGSGSYGYKGVNDKDVKEAYKAAMIDNGLCILPLEVNEDLNVERWEEKGKMKQSVFCSVNTKYLLLHTSGESQVIAGLGHGQDTMDKAAGKATTYAMKYALLYTFMTPVGAIDDTDKEHSQEKEVPKSTHKKEEAKVLSSEKVNELAAWAVKNKATIDKLKEHYKINPTQEKLLADEMQRINTSDVLKNATPRIQK